MVSESNTNMRHLQISNTHHQIHYNNNTSKPGGHIQKSIQFKYVVYQMGQTWGQIHLYLKVFKYCFKYLYLMFRN